MKNSNIASHLNCICVYFINVVNNLLDEYNMLKMLDWKLPPSKFTPKSKSTELLDFR